MVGLNRGLAVDRLVVLIVFTVVAIRFALLVGSRTAVDYLVLSTLEVSAGVVLQAALSSIFTELYISDIEIARLGRNGVGNCTHCGEEENGNLGELHCGRLVL